MGREKLVLTKKEARNIIFGDSEDFTVVSDEIVDHRRWSVDHEVIVKRLSDNKYFRDHYSQGATESQDEGAYEYSDPDFTEVFPVEKTIIVFK